MGDFYRKGGSQLVELQSTRMKSRMRHHQVKKEESNTKTEEVTKFEE
jgi:hypothetical protein